MNRFELDDHFEFYSRNIITAGCFLNSRGQCGGSNATKQQE